MSKSALEEQMGGKKTYAVQVGDIGNYYGCLNVKEKDGKYFWSIEDYNGHDWQEIPKYLYDALIKFNDE